MERKRVVVTGAAGMLGRAVVDLAPPEYEAIGVDLADGDITKPHGARAAIRPHEPWAVIHCAAMTDVEGCTRNPEAAHTVNARGTANVAIVCHECLSYLIVLSTDYVFDGEKGAPYTETDEPNPVNAYGQSKLMGELYAREAHDQLLIVRTQWLHGPHGKSFVRTVVDKARQVGELRIVADEYGSPTYTRDLAARLWELLPLRATGVLHCANTGICSWADLARTALAAAGLKHVTVTDISWRDWESPTRRPHYTPLVSARLVELGLHPMRPWQEGVVEHVSQYLVCGP